MKKIFVVLLITALLLVSCSGNTQLPDTSASSSAASSEPSRQEESTSGEYRLQYLISDYKRALLAYGSLVTASRNAVAAVRECLSADLTDEACAKALDEVKKSQKQIADAVLENSAFAEKTAAVFSEYGISYADYLVIFDEFDVEKTLLGCEGFVGILETCVTITEINERRESCKDVLTKLSDNMYEYSELSVNYIFYGVNGLFAGLSGAKECLFGGIAVFSDDMLEWQENGGKADRIMALYDDDINDNITKRERIVDEYEKKINAETADMQKLADALKSTCDRLASYIGKIDLLYRSVFTLSEKLELYTKQPSVSAGEFITESADSVIKTAADYTGEAFEFTDSELAALAENGFSGEDILAAKIPFDIAAEASACFAQYAIAAVREDPTYKRLPELITAAETFIDACVETGMYAFNCTYSLTYAGTDEYCKSKLESSVVNMTIPEWISETAGAYDAYDESLNRYSAAEEAFSEITEAYDKEHIQNSEP